MQVNKVFLVHSKFILYVFGDFLKKLLPKGGGSSIACAPHQRRIFIGIATLSLS